MTLHDLEPAHSPMSTMMVYNPATPYPQTGTVVSHEAPEPGNWDTPIPYFQDYGCYDYNCTQFESMVDVQPMQTMGDYMQPQQFQPPQTQLQPGPPTYNASPERMLSIDPSGRHYSPPIQQPPAYNQKMTYAYGYQHSSPAGSSTQGNSDENEEQYGCYANTPYKRSPPIVELDVRGRRMRQSKKRKPRRDPNEPQKPVSAYALFFRDTQAAIKGQNPNATFGEVSKIVASMWDSLDADAKNTYKQKTEMAKKDYLKQLAAYRANQVSKGCSPTSDGFAEFTHHAKSKMAGGGGALGCHSPDSTVQEPPTPLTPISDVGAKSLASLIAEPAPQHVLTATTTLTVPQSYIPTRASKAEAESCKPEEWVSQSSNLTDYECLTLTHCRDVYGNWVSRSQAGAYAPV